MRSVLWLVPAALTEVSWIAGVKHAESAVAWLATTGCVAASIYCALKAARQIPMATVYVAFVGLGTVGTVLLDVTLFDTRLPSMTYAWLGLVLAGVIGLQLLGDERA